MTFLDHRPISMTRRQLLGASLGVAFLSQFGSTATTAQTSEPWTFLVLGLDQLQEETSQRSDIIMIARVDPATGTIRVLSIPRDLYAEIPGHGWDKINAAFQVGLAASGPDDWDGAALHTARTLAHNFGIDFDGYVVIDFEAFSDVIDAVGGVDVINPYDLGEPDAATKLIYPEGPLHLDGEQALLYCRLRHQDGDGGRVMRQQLVLQALLAKLQGSDSISQIPQLVTTFQGNVRSNIDTGVQLELLTMLPGLTAEDMTFSNIDTQLTAGYTAGGAWIYEADWSTLPAYVQAWLDGEIE